MVPLPHLTYMPIYVKECDKPNKHYSSERAFDLILEVYYLLESQQELTADWPLLFPLKLNLI